jgi:hypothetical protein
MKRDSLLENLKIILAIEAIVLLAGTINEPIKNTNATRPPSITAPVNHANPSSRMC